MRERYYDGEEGSKSRLLIGGMVVAVLILGGVAGYTFLGKKDLVSPVPPKADFEVVYFTPSPEPPTPSLAPSETPTPTGKGKGVPKATSTPKPTGAKTTGTVTPTGKIAASPTGKNTPSPTAKLTPTPTTK